MLLWEPEVSRFELTGVSARDPISLRGREYTDRTGVKEPRRPKQEPRQNKYAHLNQSPARRTGVGISESHSIALKYYIRPSSYIIGSYTILLGVIWIGGRRSE